MEDSDIPAGYEDDKSAPTAWLKEQLTSKCLSGPKSRYFPTELEMAGLCWAVKRLRHMVETAPRSIRPLSGYRHCQTGKTRVDGIIGKSEPAARLSLSAAIRPGRPIQTRQTAHRP